jgi:Ala-tRNA(Pro) deacylase
MTTLERCIDFLNRGRVRYAHTRHPLAYTAREVAAAEALSPHKLAKTVVYLDDHGFGLAVVPADRLVNLDVLQELLRDYRLRLATEREIADLFPGCELGAMPPFGNLFDMPVFVDAELATQEFIAFNAGTHRDVIHMSFGDFRRLVNPAIASFGCEWDKTPVLSMA